ncbi:MAG TPA: hypothetical protein DCQ58_00360, partial [Saprospirales bacterium]|nr:hypothetical protein [Saprospirales bacterium]
MILRNVFITAIFLLNSVFGIGQELNEKIVDPVVTGDKVSSFGMVAQIRSQDVAALIQRNLKNPIIKGSTPEVGILMHSNETITKERLTKVIVTPAKAAYDEIRRIPRTVTQTIKIGEKTIECIGRIFSGKSCKEDIFKEIKQIVYDEVKVRVPAAEAVYQDVMVPVIELNQTLIPLRGKFDYTANLDQLEMHFDKNRFTLTGLFNINIKTIVSVGLLPESIKPRGSFHSTFKVRITETGLIQLLPDGSVKISQAASKLEFVEVFGSDFVVNSVKTGAKSTSVTEYFMDATGDEINKKLSITIEEAINKEINQFNLKSFAQNMLKDLDKPIQLNENALFYPNVTGLFIAPPSGSTEGKTNLLTIRFGVTLQPFVTFEATPAAFPSKDELVHFGTEITTSEGIDISMRGFMSYDYISQQLLPFIDEINQENEKELIVRNYLAANPCANFLGNDKMNVTVDLIRKKSGKKIGYVSLNTTLTANTPDTTICTEVTDIKVKTSDLGIFLIKGILKKTLRKEAEDNACISFGKEV